jgi:hypothetical protein
MPSHLLTGTTGNATMLAGTAAGTMGLRIINTLVRG